jgi:hypothetical protein
MQLDTHALSLSRKVCNMQQNHFCLDQHADFMAVFDPPSSIIAVSDPDLSQPHIRKDYSHRKFSQSYKNKDVLAGVWPDIDDEVYISGMLVTAPGRAESVFCFRG